MHLARILLAAAAVASLPAAAQTQRAYFSLATSRTFAPGEKAVVQLAATNVSTLQFRAYRIQDPVQFFRQLREYDQVGGRVARPRPAQTPVERFHRFKLRLRSWMRDLVRGQFSAESRAQIRDALYERRLREVRSQQQSTSYAAVPLLNPQRVVRVWDEVIAAREGRWASQAIPVDVRDKGLYLVEATDGKLRAYTIVLVTDIAVLSKSGPGRVFAQVVNRRSGEPVARCPVFVLGDGKEIAQAITDAQGVIEVAVRAPRLEQLVVMASHGADFAPDRLWAYNISEHGTELLMGYVYTDRPVYRPGHTVYLRAVLREQAGAGYRLPERTREVDVEVTDPEGESVFHKPLPVSAFGSVHAEIELGPSAALGYYGIQVGSGETRAHGGFEVEEYKKPEYEVKITAERPRVVQGETMAATVEARYYFGEPVANGKVAWTVRRSHYWSPVFWREPEDLDEDQGERDIYGGEQVQQGTGQLDAQGRIFLKLPTETRERDVIYRIEASVTDPGNREISGSGYVIATVGSFLLNTYPEQYVYSPGENATVVVESRDYDGKPVDTTFDLTIDEWRWNRPEGRQIYSGSGHTGASGRTTLAVRAPGAGSYIIHARARTPEGREVTDEGHLWISGEGGFWAGTQRERVEIVPDKRSYAAGDKAKVLIITGVPEAHVIVSLEGRDMHTVQVVHAKASSFTYEAPIKAEYAPGVYVTAAFIRDNQLFHGSKRLKVPPVEQQLAVKLEASKPQYKPGEPATFTIEARDFAGRPAAAEFSLGVVDEAIYAIRRETVQDILKFFYGYGWNRVGTDSSLTYHFSGSAGQRAMQLASVRRRNLAQLKPERFADAAVRKAFPDTAFWAADLRTDAAGRAEARFSFPDALTTWRATARGVTADSRVGSAVQKVIVRKNLILRLAAPRFLIEGDEVTVSALVHNYLETQKTVRVSLDVTGADVLEGAARDVPVASKGDARLDWRLRAKAGVEVKLLGKALADQESDALEITLPVHPYGVRMTEARAGLLAETSGEAAAELTFPEAASKGSRSLEISVAPSLAGAILSALEYLTSFPYGCTEQTMSSFLPNVVVNQVVKQLGLKGAVDEAALHRKIRAGLDRLYDYQHGDGGWGWWKTDDSDPFMTAYVVAGLSQAEAAGVKVNTYNAGRGAAWLAQQYPLLKDAETDLRAYIAYTLALGPQRPRREHGENELSPAQVLDDAAGYRSSMTPYGLALLGLAMQQSKDNRASDIVDELIRRVRETATEASWPLDRDTLMRFHFDTTPEATAYAVKLLTAVRPDSPLLPKAVTWLVNHRRDGSYWNSTKQTAMVIYGITDYLKLSGELKPDYSVSIRVNGREVLARQFTAADALAPKPPSIRLGEAELTGAGNAVSFTKNGAGRLYWSARAEYRAPAAGRADNNLRVTREYFRLAPEREGDHFVYALQPLEGALKPGELVGVRLILNAPGTRYVMTEDPIPAGAEFIERDDLYTLKDRPGWWRWWFTRREFHDDRAALFQTWMTDRPIEYVYLLKIVNPGVFRVGPARAGPMYEPERFATSDARTVEVRP